MILRGIFFSFGSKELSFIVNEVALILGLPNSGEDVRFAIKPYVEITKTDLKRKLDHMARKPEDMEADALILHLLMNFFFPSSGDRIPERLVKLADLTEFVRHNWPKAVHTYLVTSMKTIANKISQLKAATSVLLPNELVGYMHGCTHLIVVSIVIFSTLNYDVISRLHVDMYTNFYLFMYGF